ncbi:MAG: helix-turn-helix transcriptional regulator [Rhizobacter sp.]|nr:helix-turn-helix transcriptional regulator [Rhizobacter sp.]
MALQFTPSLWPLRPVPLPAVAAPYGRMHLVRDGFLYAGLLSGVTSQRHSALVYLALTPSEFTIEMEGSRLCAAAALVGPGVHKRFEGGDHPVVSLDICPTHRHYRAFAPAQGATVAWPREHFEGLAGALAAFHEGSLGSAESDRLYCQLVELAVQRLPAVKPIDPRVREVMRLLRENRGHSIQQLADAVCLSKDWLVHLFQREAGISLRKYEQTLKLQAAAVYVNRGVSMTKVAAIAGFADSAHFSKMWKQNFGFPPNRFFVCNDQIAIDPVPWPTCIERPAGAEAGRDALYG